MADPAPLKRIIIERILTDGPMPVGDYMAMCLTHPQHGYYTTGTPVGGRASAQRSGGDFITAPEVSQMFGELIGVWCMEVWQALGSPDPFVLAEIGPGRGTLMKDLMRAGRAMPGFLNAARIAMVEISPTLAEQQSLTLGKNAGQVTWVRSMEALPEGPVIAVGNELLDALPFSQWVMSEGRWHERCVAVQDDELIFVARPSAAQPTGLPETSEQVDEGAIFETAPIREAFVHQLAERLTRENGAALLVDYGHVRSDWGDTFQAVRDHAYVSPLTEPGLADLTSHVDFEPLVAAARAENCVVPRPVTQGQFLLALGLLERAGALGSGREKHVQESLQQAVERLAGPDQMGDLFKVMAFGAPASLGERWPGFV